MPTTKLRIVPIASRPPIASSSRPGDFIELRIRAAAIILDFWRTMGCVSRDEADRALGSHVRRIMSGEG